MAYAAIMVSATPDAASDARLALAQRLAGRFEAALIGIAAEAPIMALAGDVSMGGQAEFIEYEVRRVEANLAEAARRFNAVLRPEAADRVEWRSFNEHPPRALAREARSADLLVLGAGGVVDAGDVLMTAGRPVLVVPQGVGALQARQVVIGWQDAPQSRRAVADALPLLRRAEGVLVLALAEQDMLAEAEPGTRDVVAYLARHGVSAQGEARTAPDGRVAAALIGAAQDRGADLIVSGGYGHARAREWAFGGVTRGLLTHCPVCCLMSH